MNKEARRETGRKPGSVGLAAFRLWKTLVSSNLARVRWGLDLSMEQDPREGDVASAVVCFSLICGFVFKASLP